MKNNKINNNIKKLLIDIIIFFAFFILSIYLLLNGVNYNNSKTIYYEEKSNLDYKVYLKKNDFFNTNYLEKDKLYIASLIDKIKIYFNYNYNIYEKENIKFNYKIIGKLIIFDNTGNKVYYEKEYSLLNNKTVLMNNQKEKIINEEIDIDYSKYNEIASKFKSSYQIDTESKFIINMTINKRNIDSNLEYINDTSIMSITIPLSKKSVEISLDYKDVNNSNYIIKNESYIKKNIPYIIMAIITIFLTIFMVIKIKRNIFKIIKKKTKYDKYVNKLLREYDRLIVETYNLISLENKEIILLKKFNEILDVHDNLQLPILYHVITKHKKCYFYIVHGDIAYLYIVSASNFGDKNEK